MVIVDFIMKLIGRPTLLPNGYPNMARNHQYVDNDGEVVHEVGRRINGGGYYFPPPPPPIPQIQTPVEKPAPAMVSEVVNEINNKQQTVRSTPTSTSSLMEHYYVRWCGSTVSDSVKSVKDEKDPLVLDHLPLRHFLMKKFPWIIDVTEVRIKPYSSSSGWSGRDMSNVIVYGPLEIHITVSPTHYSELMNPNVEKKVRDRLYNDMMPLITCMFENNHKEKPLIIFSPSHSETILEYVK